MSYPQVDMTEVTQNKSLIEGAKMLSTLKAVLPKHMAPDRFARIASAFYMRSDILYKCSRQSILQSVVKLAVLGLECDGRLAAIVPYGKDCRVSVMYAGKAELMRRSGEVSTIQAAVVYEADVFEFQRGTDPYLKHVDAITVADRGTPIAAYAVVRMKDGQSEFDVMSVDAVNRIRDNHSVSYQNAVKRKIDHPWISHWDEMAKKTVFHRLSKMLPMTPELREKISVDEETSSAESDAMKDVLDGFIDAETSQEGDPEKDIQRVDIVAEIKSRIKLNGISEGKLMAYLRNINWLDEVVDSLEMALDVANESLEKIHANIDKIIIGIRETEEPLPTKK